MILINPPSPFLLDEKVFPNLGILRVAEAIDAKVIDLAGCDDIEFELARYALMYRNVDVIGISATTPQIPSAMRIAALCRRFFPKAALVIGGPHVTLCWAGGDRAAKHRLDLETQFDAVVVGDGEQAIKRVIAGERGVIRADRRQDEGFLADGEQPTGRQRIDLASYHYEIEGHPATSLIAQLGCPFNCGFCGGRDSHAFRVIRKRDINSVVSEVEHLHRTYGYTGFMFYDDELNVNPQMVELMNGLSDLQERLGVDFRLRGFLKAELFNDEQARAMYRAGFRWVLSGFEAAHPRILSNIRKRATVADNERVIEIADRYGMKTKALMSIGHPGESEETVMEIRDWLLRTQPADFDLTIIAPYPGSPYYDKSVLNGDHWTYTIDGDNLHNLDVDWANDPQHYKGIPGEYVSYVWTDYLSRDELVEMRDFVELECRQGLGIDGPRVQHEASMGQS